MSAEEEVKPDPEAEEPEDEDEDEDNDDDVEDLPPPPPPEARKPRTSVSAEAYGAWNKKIDYAPVIIPKSEEQKNRIKATVKQSWMFEKLEDEPLKIVINAMQEKVIPAGTRIINQGEEGDVMFVIEAGELECYKKIGDEPEKLVKTCKQGDVFGELALLYFAPRAASCQAKDECTVWQLDRQTFNAIVKDAAEKAQKSSEYEGFTAPGKTEEKPKEEPKKEEPKEEAAAEDEEADEDDDDDDDDVEDLPPPPPPEARKPRTSVSAEAYGAWNKKLDFSPIIIPKSEEQKNRIKATLNQCWMFEKLEEEDKKIVINAMQEKIISAGTRMINQGEEGDVMFVIETGEMECYKKIGDEPEKLVKVCKQGDVFGELALLYFAPRAASCQAKDECTIWQLDRQTFNAIVKEAAEKSQKKEEYEGVTAPTKTEEKPKEEPKAAEAVAAAPTGQGIKNLFKSCDANQDGFLSKVELGEVFKTLDPGFDMSTLDTLFLECDIDGDGRVCINEFIDTLFPEESKVQEIWKVRKAFNQVDKNKDGYVSISELKYCDDLPPIFTEALGGMKGFKEAAEKEDGNAKTLSWMGFIAMCVEKGIVAKADASEVLNETLTKKDKDVINDSLAELEKLFVKMGGDDGKVTSIEFLTGAMEVAGNYLMAGFDFDTAAGYDQEMTFSEFKAYLAMTGRIPQDLV
jgi:CRP-like cAMP-binding protein/Ca2+-binding EF-hand superfamily protein